MEFTETGLSLDTQASLFNSITSDLSVSLAPYLNGTQLRTDDASLIGRLVRDLAKPMAENSEIVGSLMSQLDVSQATGLQLDRLAYAGYRKKRKDMALSVGFATVTGDSGAVIPAGASVSNSVSGDLFTIESEVVFDYNNICGITFAVTSIVDRYVINYSITGLVSQSPTIIVTRLGETTIEAMARRIVDAINSQQTVMNSVLNNDNTITITLDQELYYADFGLSDGLTLTQSKKLVTVKAETYQAVRVPVNTLTTKRTSIEGWRSVTNPFEIFPSTGVEEDTDFQERLEISRGNYGGAFDGIYSCIDNVRGVSFINIKTNTSDKAVGDVPAHGLAISVLGGDDDEVADAIFRSIAGGISTVGTISKVLKDVNSGEHTISFSRPDYVPLTMRMQITQYKNFPTNGKILIKQALVDYFNSLNVGDPVQFSRLYTPINSVAGFSISNLSIGKVGDNLGQQNINMTFNQIPQLSADNIFIGGS